MSGMHCATCTCAPAGAWQRYSERSYSYQRCGCGAETGRPGPDGWWWRFRAITGARSHRGRATESKCKSCGAEAGLA